MSTSRRRSPTGRTYQGGIGKQPVPFITKAIRSLARLDKPSPFMEDLTKAVEIILRNWKLAPRVRAIRNLPSKWGSLTADALHRMLSDERYREWPALLADWLVDRTPSNLEPFAELVTRAADAARQQLLTDTAAASATSVDLTNAHKMDSYTDSPTRTETPDVAAERQQGVEEYNRRVLEWYGTLQGERERKALTLLLTDPRLSDREIERQTGASREKVVRPLREQLDRLKAERLIGSPVVSAPNAPDVEEHNVAEAPTELDKVGNPADLTGEFKEVNTGVALAQGEAIEVQGGHRASAAHAPGESAQFDARDKMDRSDSANYRGGRSRREALFAGESTKWSSKDGGGPRPTEGALLVGAERPSWRDMVTGPGAAAYVPREPAPVEYRPAGGAGVISGQRCLSAVATESRRGGRINRAASQERVAAMKAYAAAGAERDKQRRLKAVADAAAADRDAKRLRAAALIQAANAATADANDADKTAQLAKFAARARITLPELRRIVDQLERDNPDVSLDWLLGMALKGEAA